MMHSGTSALETSLLVCLPGLPRHCRHPTHFHRMVAPSQLLSAGMHSSISAHIADEYLLDEQAGMWGPNLALFQQRLGNQEASARIENLYFTYLFVLRAFMKAGPLLSSAQYTTGCPQQDAETAGVMQQLVSPATGSSTASAAFRCTFKLLLLNEGYSGLVVLRKRHTGLLLLNQGASDRPHQRINSYSGRLQVANQALQEACPVPFDEGRLWKGADAPALKHQLQQHFQNITQVMDCVGCEKCKLWGKLQILGECCLWALVVILLQHRPSQLSAACAAASCTVRLSVAACDASAGIATSMKVLFSAEDCDGSQTEAPTLVLERNEVIAIVNLLQRLSHSIEVVRRLSKQLEDNPAGQTYGSVAELTGSSLHALLTTSTS